MQDKLEAILSFHCPRFEELPDLEIYMDQVLQLLNRYLSLLNDPNEDKVMTKTMINNYVKHGIVKPPIKKKYTREHLAYLIVISFLKLTFSMTEIKSLIKFQMKTYPASLSYNYFCGELEECLRATFLNRPINHVKANNPNPTEVYLLQSAIQSVTYKIYVQQMLNHEINKDIYR